MEPFLISGNLIVTSLFVIIGKNPIFVAQSHEDAQAFVKEFKRSCICNGLTTKAQWAEFLPTFLDIAAHRWYETLDEALQNSWDQVQERFLKEFGPREKYSDLMIKITKLGQGANEKIRDYYARSQELRKNNKAQVRKENLSDDIINGLDKLLLKHFIFEIR